MGRVGKVLAGAAGLAVSGGYVLGHLDEGIGRSQTYWSRAFPLYARYRWVQFLHRDIGYLGDDEANARYEELHDYCSEKSRQLCLDMRGFYLKNAQMMSSREDFIPPQYIKWMREMEDQAPTPFEPGEAERVIEAELGKPVSEVFSYFDPNPSGVASIGQVHRAVLKDGREVAVKVQHMAAEHLFRGDIRTIKNFCEYFMPQYVPAFDEIEKQFLTEFNYVEEAKNLEKVRTALLPKWKEKIVIPQAYLELCSRKVLTMDYLHGVKLVDGVKASFRKLASKMGMTLEELEEEQRRKLKAGELQLKTITEETVRFNKVQQMLQYQDLFVNFFIFLANLTPVPYVCHLISQGHLTPFSYQKSVPPINLGAVMRTLVDVHADQLLLHGVFNGDPHPGNILLMDDGRLGLIDFGQVKHLTPIERRAIADIIANLAVDNIEGTAEALQRLGNKTRYGKKLINYKTAAFWFDRDTDDIMTLNGRVHNIAEFLDATEAADPVEHVPDSMIMPGRMIILLRSLGLAFGMRLSMAKLLETHAKSCIEETNSASEPQAAEC